MMRVVNKCTTKSTLLLVNKLLAVSVTKPNFQRIHNLDRFSSIFTEIIILMEKNK